MCQLSFDNLPSTKEPFPPRFPLSFKIGIAAQTVFETLEDGVTVAGGDAFFTHGAFGRTAQIIEDAARVVFHIAQDIGHGVAADLAHIFVAAVLAAADGDHIGIAHEVMEVAQGLLIRSHEEGSEVILLAVAQGVEIEGMFEAL